MIVDVLVPEIKRLVISVRVLALKDHTRNSVFFVLVVLFLLALLQQVVCKIPENQIIISTYN